MSLQELLGGDKLLRKELSFNDQDASDGESPLLSADESDQPEQTNRFGEFSSLPELMEAYNRAKTLVQEKADEAERYRRDLEGLGDQTRLRAQQAEDEAFMRQMRGYYEKDGFAATDAMIRRAQQEVMALTDMRIAHTLHDERNFKRALEDFFSDPANSRLRPYEEELEFLIRQKGLFPKEAATLLRNLEDKRDSLAKKRSAAAKVVRNRSAVESEGEIGEPLDTDKQLDRIINKSKTLEEMFTGLRKLKL